MVLNYWQNVFCIHNTELKDVCHIRNIYLKKRKTVLQYMVYVFSVQIVCFE